MKKTAQMWAKVQVKDGFEYKAGEVVEVSSMRRLLTMLFVKGKQKIVRCTVSYEI